jgi:hypothetical protein
MCSCATAAPHALGHLPGVSYFLKWSGLSADDVSAIDVSTDHGGVRLHVSAGYADENETVLILDYQGPKGGGTGAGGFGSLTLTDQFGHTYSARVAGFGEKGQPIASGHDIAGYVAFDTITGRPRSWAPALHCTRVSSKWPRDPTSVGRSCSRARGR